MVHQSEVVAWYVCLKWSHWHFLLGKCGFTTHMWGYLGKQPECLEEKEGFHDPGGTAGQARAGIRGGGASSAGDAAAGRV